MGLGVLALVVHLLTLDALDRANAGDQEGAVRAARAALNAAHSLEDEPFVVSQLTRKNQAVAASRTVQVALNKNVLDAETLAEMERA